MAFEYCGMQFEDFYTGVVYCSEQHPCSECKIKSMNYMLHEGHCKHLDICENCVKVLGREYVKVLITHFLKSKSVHNTSKEGDK